MSDDLTGPLPTPAAGVADGRLPSRLPVLVLVLALLLLPVLGVSAPSHAAPGDDGIQVQVTALGPEVLTPDDTLTVAGTVRNSGAEPAEDLSVELRLRTTRPSSRNALDQWLNADAAFVTRVLNVQRPEEALAPGATASFSFTVEPEDVPLPPAAAAWGPRGLAVTADATMAGVRVTDSTRTFIVWRPGSTALPTAVSVVLPLAPTASEWTTGAEGDGVTGASASRVTEIVAASAELAEVTWALDPALLDVPGSPAGGAAPEATAEPPDGQTAEPTAGSTAAPSSAAKEPTTEAPDQDRRSPTAGTQPPSPARLAAQITAGAVGREVIGFPYADADVAALVDDEEEDLLADVRTTGEAILAGSGIEPLAGVGWPVPTGTGPATIEALAATGTEAVLLPADRLPPSTPPTFTPTGRADVAAGDERVAGLLWDDALSSALGGEVVAAESDRLGPEAASLRARQYLLAVTAMIGLERPNDARHVLVTLGRDAAGRPDGLAARLSALASVPWVELERLSTLVAEPAQDLARTELADPASSTGISAAEADRITASRERLARFATIATDADALVRTEDLALLAGTSASWRTDPEARSAYLTRADRAVSALEARVGVVPSGTVNLIASSGDLPLTIRNELDQAIVARVRLMPDDPAVQVLEVVPVEAPAGSEQPVEVPIRAVGSADVAILAELTDPSGRRVGTAAVLTVRVRADWENLGTAIAATVIGVGFMVGLVRSIRRGRRQSSGGGSDA